MLDDQFNRTNIVVPVTAGLLLGTLQTLAFGPRATLIAGAIGLLGVATLLLAFTLVTQAAGIAIGCLLVWSARSIPRRINRPK